MNQNQIIRFSLNLEYEQYLRAYQSAAINISVIANDGRRIAFPARNVQSFLTKDGINGYFEMQLTSDNQFISIKKLS